MSRADVLAELDRFTGRTAGPAEISRTAPGMRGAFERERLRGRDHLICIQPRLPRGLEAVGDKGRRSVYLVGEDEDKFFGVPIEDGPRARPREFQKFSWQKVGDGLCPPLLVRRRFTPEMLESQLVTAEDDYRRVNLAYDSPAIDAVSRLPAGVTITVQQRAGQGRAGEIFEFRGGRLTIGDRILLWLFQNRGRESEVGTYSAPRSFSGQAIADALAVDRATFSQTVGRLEGAGLLTRMKRRVFPDGRGAVDTFVLTPRGRDLVASSIQRGLFPPNLPARAATSEAVKLRAARTLRAIVREDEKEIQQFARTGQELRDAGEDVLADQVRRAERLERDGQAVLSVVIRGLEAR